MPHSPLKEKGKLEKRSAKLEELISGLENEIKLLQAQLLLEDVYTDYLKLKEIQAGISGLSSKLDTYMLEWEDIQERLNNFEV